MDPLGYVDGMNLYASYFVVNGVDPSGEIVFVPILAGMLIGAGMELGIQLLENGGRVDCVDWLRVGAWGAVGGVGGLLNGARLLSNTGRLLRNSRVRYSMSNMFWDNRNFRAVSQQYWRRSGGAGTQHLHHIWVQNQTRWVPKGVRNSGINLMELPAGINRWAGGRRAREITIRGTVAGLGAGSFYQGTQIGSALGSHPQTDCKSEQSNTDPCK
jgi:hypothetical protein